MRRLSTYQLFAAIVFLLFLSCKEKNNTSTTSKISEWKRLTIQPRFSHGFLFFESDSLLKIVSRNPVDTNVVYGEVVFNRDKGLHRICITSTTHSFLFDALKSNNRIIGCSGQKYIQDSALLNTYKKLSIEEIGSDDQLNREKIISLKPDGIMVYPFEGNDYSAFEKAKIPVLYNADYLEEHPLARAEWILVAGALSNKLDEAKLIFDQIAKEYLSLSEKVKSNPNKPKVLLGKPIDQVWYIPGIKSYAAQFIIDAGGLYMFDDLNQNNVKSMPLEKIIMRSNEMEYWIYTDASSLPLSYQALAIENPLFKTLNPYKTQKVFACNTSQADYFGKGIIEPHVMLKDIVSILEKGDCSNNTYFKPLEK